MLEPSLIKGTQLNKVTKDNLYIQEVLRDYQICRISREVSLLGRKEVLSGKGKFGIFGAGKEVPQVALAKAFKKGDYRSGYYRDQTLMFALDICSVEDFFAQLYADTKNDPFSGGRQMNTHFATPFIDKQSGEWTNHQASYNISSDISCTAGQMGRALGLALASKKYKELKSNFNFSKFSNEGNEVCFCTIGDASTSEGVFWESINAAGVMKIPLAISIWDDGYGISVPSKYQTTKQSISEVLKGFKLDETGEGIDIYKSDGWDYPTLVKLYEKGIEKVRQTHIPAIFHIEGLTQPQGHSTSGSHERYKSLDRLDWEREHDCILKMRNWILSDGLATEEDLLKIEQEAKTYVKECKNRAWNAYLAPVRKVKNQLQAIYANIIKEVKDNQAILQLYEKLNGAFEPLIAETYKNGRQLWMLVAHTDAPTKINLKAWLEEMKSYGASSYHTHLYSQTPKSALAVPIIQAEYNDESKIKNGYEVINDFFDIKLGSDQRVIAFGEDVGKIGDVNQGFAGLQEKYGEERVFDTGIREWTIMGQAIGLAMRGLRPIAEIQYLDYLVYGLTPLTDDLATLRFRSNGIQAAPAIIRSRGHRLEGIWHAGSPMGMLIHALRGIYILVPRNMVQAAGFYNTMLQSDDPALVIECLNGYRLKEKQPNNINEFTVPLGVPEILEFGTDVTLVTYGSCVRIAMEGIALLKKYDIFVELIDVQSLLPFDLEHSILTSVKKTNRIVFMDEDVPGGATAYMMQEVMEKQKAYQFLDASPKTITASAHRPPYGSDGDYFSKPHPEDVFDAIYEMMNEADPSQFPEI